MDNNVNGYNINKWGVLSSLLPKDMIFKMKNDCIKYSHLKSVISGFENQIKNCEDNFNAITDEITKVTSNSVIDTDKLMELAVNRNSVTGKRVEIEKELDEYNGLFSEVNVSLRKIYEEEMEKISANIDERIASVEKYLSEIDVAENNCKNSLNDVESKLNYYLKMYPENSSVIVALREEQNKYKNALDAIQKNRIDYPKSLGHLNAVKSELSTINYEEFVSRIDFEQVLKLDMVLANNNDSLTFDYNNAKILKYSPEDTRFVGQVVEENLEEVNNNEDVISTELSNDDDVVTEQEEVPVVEEEVVPFVGVPTPEVEEIPEIEIVSGVGTDGDSTTSIDVGNEDILVEVQEEVPVIEVPTPEVEQLPESVVDGKKENLYLHHLRNQKFIDLNSIVVSDYCSVDQKEIEDRRNKAIEFIYSCNDVDKIESLSVEYDVIGELAIQRKRIYDFLGKDHPELLAQYKNDLDGAENVVNLININIRINDKIMEKSMEKFVYAPELENEFVTSEMEEAPVVTNSGVGVVDGSVTSVSDADDEEVIEQVKVTPPDLEVKNDIQDKSLDLIELKKQKLEEILKIDIMDYADVDRKDMEKRVNIWLDMVKNNQSLEHLVKIDVEKDVITLLAIKRKEKYDELNSVDYSKYPDVDSNELRTRMSDILDSAKESEELEVISVSNKLFDIYFELLKENKIKEINAIDLSKYDSVDHKGIINRMDKAIKAVQNATTIEKIREYDDIDDKIILPLAIERKKVLDELESIKLSEYAVVDQDEIRDNINKYRDKIKKGVFHIPDLYAILNGKTITEVVVGELAIARKAKYAEFNSYNFGALKVSSLNNKEKIEKIKDKIKYEIDDAVTPNYLDVIDIDKYAVTLANAYKKYEDDVTVLNARYSGDFEEVEVEKRNGKKVKKYKEYEYISNEDYIEELNRAKQEFDNSINRIGIFDDDVWELDETVEEITVQTPPKTFIGKIVEKVKTSKYSLIQGCVGLVYNFNLNSELMRFYTTPEDMLELKEDQNTNTNGSRRR